MTEPTRSGRRTGGVDRISVGLFSAAAFLLLLAVLISQMHVPTRAPAPRVVLLRKVYTTTVVETIRGGGKGGTTVSQTSSSPPSTPAAAATPAAPTTRVS